jgi:hypothetical protein
MSLFKPSIDKLRANGDVQGLVKALHHKDSTTRREAVETLGELGPKGIPTWKTIDFALGREGPSRQLPPPVPEDELRGAVEPLIGLLSDEDYVTRGVAAKALGDIADARAVDPLIAALRDEETIVRENAAYALGAIGDPRAVDPLIATLEGQDHGARKNAAWALGEIGDDRAVEPLTAGQSDPVIQERAIAALSMLDALPATATSVAGTSGAMPEHAIIFVTGESGGSSQYLLPDGSRTELKDGMLGSELAWGLGIQTADQVDELFEKGRTATTGLGGTNQTVTLEWCDCNNPDSHRREGAAQLG